MSENGIDTSKYQAGLPDATIPADFIIFKATEGVGYTDSDCAGSYAEAKAAGKQVGVYHFARPDGNDPISEANWFVSQIQGYIGEALLMLDLEVNPITPSWAKQWLDQVYNLTKVRAVLYMSQSRYNSQDWSALMPDYAAWPAMYGANNPQTGYGAAQAPVSINGNWTIAGWQYTSDGYLPGYANRLDLDMFYGDANAWAKYAQGDRNTPVAQPAPAPAPTPVVTPPVVDPTPTPPVDPTPPIVTTPTPPIVVPPVIQDPIPVTQTPVVDTPVPTKSKPWYVVFIEFIIGLFKSKKA